MAKKDRSKKIYKNHLLKREKELRLAEMNSITK